MMNEDFHKVICASIVYQMAVSVRAWSASQW